MEQRLALVDPVLQLDLEIALSGVSAKVKPFSRFLVRPKVVKTSADVITNDSDNAPDKLCIGP